MKTSTIPSVRIESELRGQAAFLKRGLASLERARQGAGYVSADAVVRGLEKRLAEARASRAALT